MAWNLGSKKHPDGTREVMVYFDSDDATGRLSGWMRFKGKTYIVSGVWAAAGSVKGRNHSILTLTASNQQPAPVFLAMAGTIDDGKGGPARIDLNIIGASSVDDKQTGWGGVLLPLPPGEAGSAVPPQ